MTYPDTGTPPTRSVGGKMVDLPPEEQKLSGAFNPDEYDWPRHLKVALDDLKNKNVEIDRAWAYYDGRHPKVWLTDAIKDKLDNHLIANMAENWCDVAVDSPVRRLMVEGFTDRGSVDQEVKNNVIMSKAALNVWKDNDLRLAQKDIYTGCGVAGEAFVFAWKDDTKDTGIDATIKDSRNVWWPKDAHRADPDRVLLVWPDHEEGVWRATCYYKFVVVRLVGPKLKDSGNVTPIDNMGNFGMSNVSTHEVFPQARYFVPDPDDPGGEHGFEKVPVLRFAPTTVRRSLVIKLTTLQDKINKLAANLLVTAEFNAWRKMAILTEQTIDDETLKMRPNRIAVLDPGGGVDGAAPTSIWEGAETDLSKYSDEQDKLIDKLFTKASLPGHMKVKSTNVAPSGAAYEADEGPFTEYVSDLKDSYGETWHDFFELVLGIDIECQWRDPHVKSEFDQAQTVKMYVDAGVPMALALKYYAGWSDEQLKEIATAPLSPKEELAQAASKALAAGPLGADTGAPGQPLPPAKPGAPSVPGTKPAFGNRPAQKQATSAKPKS